MLNIQLHLNELKCRTIYIFFSFCITFFLSYLYVDILMYLLAIPFLKNKCENVFLLENDFIFTNIFEAFFSYIVISFIVTTYITLPFFLYTIFGFVQFGLYYYEKKNIYIFLTTIFILSLFAIYLIYNFFLPLTFKFFLSFEELTKTRFFTLKLEQKIIDYVYLTLSYSIVIILAFQLPLFIYYILKYELLSFFFFKQNRRIFIISFFFCGCLLSPPDLYSLLLISLPLSVCFESIFFFFQVKESYKIILYREVARLARG